MKNWLIGDVSPMDTGRVARELTLFVLVGVLLALVGCGGNPDPKPPPPPPPPPAGEPSIIWRSADQVELSWTDMPVTVHGGSESSVLRRSMTVILPETRHIANVQSFAGFDRGDVIEATLALYNQANEAVYRLSPHLEGGVPECYPAYDPPTPPLVNTPASRLVLDAECRVNGPNDFNGKLTARCHFAVTVTFGDGTPPPPPPGGCSIAGPNDPKWNPLGLPRTTRKQLDAAKAVVGDRTGKDPLETLRLLAQAVRTAGGCAVGPWDDEVAILRSDGHTDGWHAVAFGTGGYTGTPKGDAWVLGNPPTAGCGAPVPQRITRVKAHKIGNLPKPTFDSTYLVGPNAQYCAAVGFTDGRSFCTVRPEGHPERAACEGLFKPPIWTYVGTSRCFARPNPFVFRCERDAVGTLTACDGDTGTVCAAVVVE